jgi:hypothetical protein
MVLKGRKFKRCHHASSKAGGCIHLPLFKQLISGNASNGSKIAGLAA